MFENKKSVQASADVEALQKKIADLEAANLEKDETIAQGMAENEALQKKAREAATTGGRQAIEVDLKTDTYRVVHGGRRFTYKDTDFGDFKAEDVAENPKLAAALLEIGWGGLIKINK